MRRDLVSLLGDRGPRVTGTTIPDSVVGARGRPGVPGRTLGTVERVFEIHGRIGAFQTAQVALVAGPVTADLVRAALSEVAIRHPLLGSAIVMRDRRPWYEPGRVIPPLHLAEAGATPASLLERDLHRLMPPEGPLWRCALAAPAAAGAPAALAFGMHHAVGDGIAAYQACVEVLEACARIRAGGAPPPPEPLPPAVDEQLDRPRLAARVAHRVHRLAAAVRARRGEFPFAAVAGAAERRSRIQLLVWPAPGIERIRARARRERATVDGLLAVVAADACRRTFGVAGRFPVGLQVGLRPLSGSPADVIACMTAGVNACPDPREATGTWERARCASAAIRRAVEGGEPVAALRATSHRLGALERHIASALLDGRTLGRTGWISISNRGEMRPPQPSEFALTGYWSAAANHPVGNILQLSCGTLHGDLHASVCWVEPLVSDEAAQAFVGEVVARLDAASRGDA
jgi:hypothetical protein